MGEACSLSLGGVGLLGGKEEKGKWQDAKIIDAIIVTESDQMANQMRIPKARLHTSLLLTTYTLL
jgi:hypothetical protein